MAMPTTAPPGTALFLKRWLRRPLAVGAVVPSGRWLTDRMGRKTPLMISIAWFPSSIGANASACRPQPVVGY